MSVYPVLIAIAAGSIAARMGFVPISFNVCDLPLAPDSQRQVRGEARTQSGRVDDPVLCEEGWSAKGASNRCGTITECGCVKTLIVKASESMVNKKSRAAEAKLRYWRIRETYLDGLKTKRKLLRAVVLSHYGNQCSCPTCPESLPEFLTIDHTTKEGRVRDGKSGGLSLYRKLIRLNFPEDVRLLCFNCNIAREQNQGVCPHSSRRMGSSPVTNPKSDVSKEVQWLNKAK